MRRAFRAWRQYGVDMVRMEVCFLVIPEQKRQTWKIPRLRKVHGCSCITQLLPEYDYNGRTTFDLSFPFQIPIV